MDRETKIDIIELARGYLGVLIISILMMTGVVSGIYAGESYSFETNLSNPIYTVTGNTSSLEGMNITFNDGKITIDTDIRMASDNFTLIFFDEKTKEVEKIIYSGGGGGGSTRYIDRNITIYVPEYINNETTNLDNKLTETDFKDEKNSKLHIYILTIIGMLIIAIVIINIRIMYRHKMLIKRSDKKDETRV